MKRTALVIIGLLAFAGLLSATLAAADPVNPMNLTAGASERGDVSGELKNATAQAGNVTRLDVTSFQLTKSWQGYFGNVTGAIVLEDGSSNVFYNWSLTTVTGEVYASRNDTINWSGVNCSESVKLAIEEENLGQSATDADSVRSTFASNAHPWFEVGTNNMTGCNSTNPYDGDGAQTNFWNVLLMDDLNRTVYTAILDDDTSGFSDTNVDFELLVGEDGHGAAASTTTTYYFFVELT